MTDMTDAKADELAARIPERLDARAGYWCGHFVDSPAKMTLAEAQALCRAPVVIAYWRERVRQLEKRPSVEAVVEAVRQLQSLPAGSGSIDADTLGAVLAKAREMKEE